MYSIDWIKRYLTKEVFIQKKMDFKEISIT